MIGIANYSVYVPRHRMRREAIATAWGAPAGVTGCKAVMNFDEDSLTMAQSAAWPLVQSGGAEALSFASTTAPYWQRSAASLIAAACDLPAQTATADFGASLRSGTTALRAALDAVAAGSVRTAVVAAADCRDGAPESSEEMLFGDAAAAVSVGSEGLVAELAAVVSRSDDFPDEWRRDSDAQVRSFASKYSLTRGYAENVVAVGRALFERAGVQAEQIARVALSSSDGRAHIAAAKALGIPASRVEEVRAGDIGITGAAMPLFLLAQALDRAKPGDLILAIAYGDGADGFLFRALGAGGSLQAAGPTIEYPTYQVYRKLRGYWHASGGSPEISNVLLRREETQNVRLHGSLCPQCGLLQFPIAKVCGSCHYHGDLIEKPLARRGRLFTFTKDFLYNAPVEPTVMAVVDLEGGGRFLCQMTDADPAAVEIGMEVELVLRRMREGPGDHYYYWKCRPIRASHGVAGG
jgi:hydroxymethylglutaryl-CoA synthase